MTPWSRERFEEGLVVRRFFDGFGYSHKVLYDNGIMRIKENAHVTLAIRAAIAERFTKLLNCQFHGAELPSAFHFHTQFVAFNPWAIDRAAEWQDPLDRGNALMHHIASDIKTSTSEGMCRDLARYFAMHARVMDNYPSAMPAGLNGGDVWEKNFLTMAQELDPCVSSLTEAKNAVRMLVAEMYPVFVRQRAKDFETLGERLGTYMRLYWRGNADRTFHPLIVNYPRFYGVSPKVVDDINAMSSFALDPFILMSMAKLLGKHWRYYVCRYAATPEAKNALLRERWTEGSQKNAAGPTGLAEPFQSVAQAIHDAGYWMLSVQLDNGQARELRNYLMKHDYARDRAHVRVVARSWAHLSREERELPPQEAAKSILRRITERLESILSGLPDALRAEVSKWVAAGASDCEEDVTKWAEKNLEQIATTYKAALSAPMPGWAKGEFVKRGFRAYWMPREDPRAMFIGHYTDCCQYLGGVAGASAVHSCTSPLGALMVVEKTGQLVATSWAWEGRDGRVCFDNIEVQRAARDPELFEEILREMAVRTGAPMVTAGVSHTQAPFKDLKRHGDGRLHLPEDYPEGAYTDAAAYVVLVP